jgi:hypothetical protein
MSHSLFACDLFCTLSRGLDYISNANSACSCDYFENFSFALFTPPPLGDFHLVYILMHIRLVPYLSNTEKKYGFNPEKNGIPQKRTEQALSCFRHVSIFFRKYGNGRVKCRKRYGSGRYFIRPFSTLEGGCRGGEQMHNCKEEDDAKGRTRKKDPTPTDPRGPI